MTNWSRDAASGRRDILQIIAVNASISALDTDASIFAAPSVSAARLRGQVAGVRTCVRLNKVI